jgi:hypothetical protein
VEDESLWWKVFEAKYGGTRNLKLTSGSGKKYLLSSKDLVVYLRLDTRYFFLNNWVGSAPLCDIFPRLFKVSLQLELTIKEMGVACGEVSESENHLLETCPSAWVDWQWSISDWVLLW